MYKNIFLINCGTFFFTKSPAAQKLLSTLSNPLIVSLINLFLIYFN